ncbi:unnamed protein product [Caenorhabditis nigoni]
MSNLFLSASNLEKLVMPPNCNRRICDQGCDCSDDSCPNVCNRRECQNLALPTNPLDVKIRNSGTTDSKQLIWRVQQTEPRPEDHIAEDERNRRLKKKPADFSILETMKSTQ